MTPTNIPTWDPLKNVYVRFCALFFGLAILTDPNGTCVPLEFLHQYYEGLLHSLIQWIGRHIVHLSYPITQFTGGSGDTTYDWLTLASLTVFSILVTIVWSAIDRRRKSYPVLYEWLTVGIRYYLAFTMIEYGAGKVVKLQFPVPRLTTLLQPYGSSSPMHLAWTFFGFSKAYNYFTGMAELIAGSLLLFRRTTRLGAILSLAVMANIMAINYCFDVCVKLLSTVLVLMCIFLLLKERHHYLAFFFHKRRKPADPEALADPANRADPEIPARLRPRRKWIRISLLVTKILLITSVFVLNIYGVMTLERERGEKAPKPPLWGIYEVTTFVKNRDTLPPLITDTLRWRKFIISSAGRASLLLMNDSVRSYDCKVDTLKKSMILYLDADTNRRSLLTYTSVGKDSLLLRGNLRSDSVHLTLRRFDERKFLLNNRGFHLISETPFNR